MTTHGKIFQIAEDYGRKLRLEDFNNYVQVIHEEGTVLFYHNATVRKYKNWYFVYPEHHNTLVYHVDEVNIYTYEKRTTIREIDESSFNT